MIYVPAGKYTIAGVVVEEAQEPGAQRPPEEMADWMAAVSSVTPSLYMDQRRNDEGKGGFRYPLAP